MKKRYETPELEVLLLDLREVGMLQCLNASKETGNDVTLYPDFSVWNDFQNLTPDIK